MSFGWSAGDIAKAIDLIVKVVKALDSADGAPAHYREAVAFLRNLQRTLEPLQTLTIIGRYPAYGAEIREQVEQIKEPIEKFLAVATEFESSLGAGAKGGRHRHIGKKLKWRFVDSKTVDALRTTVEGHVLVLNSLLHRLVLETISNDSAESKAELQKTITDVLNPGLRTLLEDNLSPLREELDADRQMRNQQHEEVQWEMQTQSNGNRHLSTEVSTSRQTSDRQYESLMSKLQQQDADLAVSVERITGHLEEQSEITRNWRRAVQEDSIAMRADASSTYMGASGGSFEEPPPIGRETLIEGLATLLQSLSLIALGYVVRAMMPSVEKSECPEGGSEPPSSEPKEEEFQSTHFPGLLTNGTGEYGSSWKDSTSHMFLFSPEENWGYHN